MIFGVGLDTIEIERVEKAISREHFYNMVFTEAERMEIEQRKPRCASNFAGKEAVVKMFGTGFGKIRACEVEILRKESGAPFVNLYGNALAFAKEHRIQNIHLSITNTKNLASAIAIGEMEGD